MQVGQWDGRLALDLLQMEQLDRDLFRNLYNQRNANDALFGGQVLAQSLKAAILTADSEGETRPLHSMHGYFLRAGKVDVPVIYQVDRTRDGGRFSTRRVTAIQNGEPIFHLECSLHQPEQGFDHQVAIRSDVLRPADLKTTVELLEVYEDRIPDWMRDRWLMKGRPIDMKPVDPEDFLFNQGAKPERRIWIRLRDCAQASAADSVCLLAYLSDYWLAGTSALPHSYPLASPHLFLASLDHAMWFHRPFRMDGWFLFEAESPTAQAGRGFARAALYAEDGTLVASTAQEALLRPRRSE